MSRAKRLVLGFDARVSPSSLGSVWSTDERQSSLVRPDVKVPLSADYLVWPSLWPVDAGGWKGPVQDLWDDPDRLRAALKMKVSRGSDCQVEVVLVCDILNPREKEVWRERARPTIIKDVSRDWQSLGFDVADRYLTSGLVRYHNSAHLTLLRRTVASQLNEYHLFFDVKKALEFAEWCAVKGQTHSPFFVYEILLM